MPPTPITKYLLDLGFKEDFPQSVYDRGFSLGPLRVKVINDGKEQTWYISSKDHFHTFKGKGLSTLEFRLAAIFRKAKKRLGESIEASDLTVGDTLDLGGDTRMLVTRVLPQGDEILVFGNDMEVLRFDRHDEVNIKEKDIVSELATFLQNAGYGRAVGIKRDIKRFLQIYHYKLTK